MWLLFPNNGATVGTTSPSSYTLDKHSRTLDRNVLAGVRKSVFLDTFLTEADDIMMPGSPLSALKRATLARRKICG
jgi:hypothetical protein